MRLTDLALRSLQPPANGQRFYADDTLPNFGIRVSQGGTKTFIIVCGDRRDKITIGRYPILSLSEARATAKRKIAEATLSRHRAPNVGFETVKEKYLEACRAKNRPATVYEYQRLLSRLKLSGRIGDIQKHQIVQALDRIKAPGERMHALRTIKILFSWAARQGYLDHNPCGLLQRMHTPASRDQVLTHDELREVFLKAGLQPYPFGPIVQLLVLTGQRCSEIAALRREWVNEDERTITFPGTITKNRRTHVIPYGDHVHRILTVLPNAGDDYFPAARTHVRGKPTTVFNGWSKAKAEFNKTLENVAPWTLHDLRRTLSSTLAALGTPIHVTEKLLNHISGTVSGVAAIYNRYNYMAEMRTAVAAFDGYLNEGEVSPGMRWIASP